MKVEETTDHSILSAGQNEIPFTVGVWRSGKFLLGLNALDKKGDPKIAAVDLTHKYPKTSDNILDATLREVLDSGYEVEAFAPDGTKVLIRKFPGDDNLNDETNGDPSGDREPRVPIMPILSDSVELIQAK